MAITPTANMTVVIQFRLGTVGSMADCAESDEQRRCQRIAAPVRGSRAAAITDLSARVSS